MPLPRLKRKAVDLRDKAASVFSGLCTIAALGLCFALLGLEYGLDWREYAMWAIWAFLGSGAGLGVTLLIYVWR